MPKRKKSGVKYPDPPGTPNPRKPTPPPFPSPPGSGSKPPAPDLLGKLMKKLGQR